jgi:predicted nucleic acid-binding protein
VNLLDAYALVALIAEEPAADEVEAILREGDVGAVVANLAEAIDTCQRIHGLPIAEVRDVLEPLLGGAVFPVVSEEREAWRAAELRGQYYNKKTSALSLADCLLLAHAVVAEAQIATSDPPLADAARSEGLKVIALPDSDGRRP